MAAARSLHSVAAFPSRSAMAVAYIAISKVSPDGAGQFYQALALKGGHVPLHGEQDPVAAWHRKWGRQTRRDRLRPEEQIALTIKCWNAYVQGAPVRVLVWYGVGPRAEPFPAPMPSPLASRADDGGAGDGAWLESLYGRDSQSMTARVRDYVYDRPMGVSAGDVAIVLHISEATARVLLARLASEGRIDRITRGVYGPPAAA
jgi:hypothetical protein